MTYFNMGFCFLVIITQIYKGYQVHAIKLNVDDSIYTQFLSYIQQFNSSEVIMLEDTVKESFIVSSTDEVKNRVLKAEASANYSSENKFWSDIDKKLETI